LLLNYAVRNPDCHAKNIVLLYTQRADVHLAPAYDVITTTVYAGYQHNPPGISFMGRKTWEPGKMLGKFIAATFGIPAKVQSEIVDAISDAVSNTAPQVRAAMDQYAGVKELRARMLQTWNEGVIGLRDKRTYSLPQWKPGVTFDGFSDPPKLDNPKVQIGRSEGLATRRSKVRVKKR